MFKIIKIIIELITVTKDMELQNSQIFCCFKSKKNSSDFKIASFFKHEPNRLE